MENELNLKAGEPGDTTRLVKARKHTSSREQMGVLLVDQLLNMAATGKHFRADGVAEIPLTVTINLLKPATERTTKTCHKVCWTSLFGVELICLTECDTLEVQGQ